MSENPLQYRRDVISHEASHAVVGWVMYGHAIDYIDVDRPRDGVAGCVEFIKPDPSEMTTAQLVRWLHESAVIFRAGGLCINTPWTRVACESDRVEVLKIGSDLMVEDLTRVWEPLVTAEAREKLADLRFEPAHRPLCQELEDTFHEVMPGDRAHQIMDDAILGGLAGMWRPHDAVRA